MYVVVFIWFWFCTSSLSSWSLLFVVVRRFQNCFLALFSLVLHLVLPSFGFDLSLFSFSSKFIILYFLCCIFVRVLFSIHCRLLLCKLLPHYFFSVAHSIFFSCHAKKISYDIVSTFHCIDQIILFCFNSEFTNIIFRTMIPIWMIGHKHFQQIMRAYVNLSRSTYVSRRKKVPWIKFTWNSYWQMQNMTNKFKWCFDWASTTELLWPFKNEIAQLIPIVCN